MAERVGPGHAEDLVPRAEGLDAGSDGDDLAGDARRALVGLTSKAKSIRGPVQQLRAGIDEESLTGFTPAEHVQLRDFLARITGNLDTMLNSPPKGGPTRG
nr:hypothetical protein [Streptomyces sp. DSM 41633]